MNKNYKNINEEINRIKSLLQIKDTSGDFINESKTNDKPFEEKNFINEEISRIKSLFGDERLYGNSINESYSKKLLVEQNVGKIFADILSYGDELSQSMAKAIRNITPDTANRFINYDIRNTRDLLSHLETFKSVWIPILKSADNYDNFVTKMRYLDEADGGVIADLKSLYQQDPAILVSLSKDLPKEAKYLYDQFFFQRVFDDNIRSTSDGVVVSKNANNEIVATTVLNGKADKNVKINDNGTLEDIKIDDQTLKNVDQYYESGTVGSGSGKTTKKVDVDETSTPQNVKDDIIKAIKEGFEDAGGKTTKSIDDIQAQIKEGSILVIKTPDNKLKVVNTVEMVEFIIDPATGTITDVKKIGDFDTTPPKSTGGDPTPTGGEPTPTKIEDPAPTGGDPAPTGGDPSPKGGKTSANVGKVINAIGQGFRWVFPTISEGIRLTVGWIPPIKNKYGGWIGGSRFASQSNRVSLFKTLEDYGKVGKLSSRGGQTTIELPARIVTEQVALITLNEVYQTYQRGGVSDDESVINLAISDYSDSIFVKYHPVAFLINGAINVVEEISDLKSQAKTGCRKKVESLQDEFGNYIYEKNEVTNSKEYKDCINNVEQFFEDVDEFKDKVKNLEFKDEWNNQEIKDFCENKDNKKTELYKDLDAIETYSKNLDQKIDELIPEDNDYKTKAATVLIGALNFLPIFDVEIPDIEDLKNKLIPKMNVDGEEVSVRDVKAYKDKLEKMCTDYMNKTYRKDEPELTDPEDNNTPPSSSPVNQQQKDSIRTNLYGQVEVVVEVVDITT